MTGTMEVEDEKSKTLVRREKQKIKVHDAHLAMGRSQWAQECVHLRGMEVRGNIKDSYVP